MLCAFAVAVKRFCEIDAQDPTQQASGGDMRAFRSSLIQALDLKSEGETGTARETEPLLPPLGAGGHLTTN